MDQNRYCVIMAGGCGSRFWPQSRKDMPKQFLDILGVGKSFIRQTFERFLPLVSPSNFIVVTNSNYKDLVLEHIPELSESQVLCEPISRNTAPCIAYAAYYIASKDPDAQIVVTPADHYITQEEKFTAAISESLKFVSENDALMTIGITPTRAETGYGYIQVTSRDAIGKVKCFTEKPNAQLAETFVQCGEFVWNSGIFVWRAKSIIDAFKTYLPECHTLFSSMSEVFGTEKEAEAVDRAFSDVKSISIDYAIMEKADNVYVKIGEFSWSDIGTWSSLLGHITTDENDNIRSEKSYLYNTKGTVVSSPSDKVVVVSGLEDYIVVDTDDVLMVCPRCEEQNIKSITEDIKYRDGDKYL